MDTEVERDEHAMICATEKLHTKAETVAFICLDVHDRERSGRATRIAPFTVDQSSVRGAIGQRSEPVQLPHS